MESPATPDEAAALRGRVAELEEVTRQLEDCCDEFRRREVQYRSLLDNVPGTVARIDLNGKYSFVNKYFLDLIGLTADQIIGHGVEVVLPFIEPESISGMVDAVKAAMLERRITETELWGRDSHGARHCLFQIAHPWYDHKGVFGGVEILTHDITQKKLAEQEVAKYQQTLENRVEERTAELKQTVALLHREITGRKQMEEALRESEETFRQLAEKSPNMIFILGKGKTVYVNEKSIDVLGYSRKEFYSKDFDFMQVHAPGYRNRVRENYQQHLKGKDVGPEEYVLLTKAGEPINALVTTKLISFGGVSSILGIVTDISELRRLEKKLAEMEIQYRIELGEELHDGLGQYLTSVSLTSKALEQKLVSGKTVTASELSKITKLVHMAIQQARDLSEGLAPSMLEAGLAVALHELAAQTRKLFSISCTCRSSGKIQIRNRSTALHLYRIAQEAATNAIRHAGASSIAMKLGMRRGRILLSISDNGRGIKNQFRNEKGFGLRIMQHRARVIGATLEITRAAPRGTEVTCILPGSLARGKTA